MSNYYQVTDTAIASEIAVILAERVKFTNDWTKYAQSLGFAYARITKGSSSLVELEFKGFVATQEQFHSIDKSVYKFLTNIRGSDLKEYSVWGFRKSNKKAYKKLLEGAPCDPSEIRTLIDVQKKLVESFSPVHGVGEIQRIGDVIIFGTGGLLPVKVREGIAKPILQSLFLALQGR